jgi:hypothetical protein
MADERTERVTFRLSKTELAMLQELAVHNADADDTGDGNTARALRLMIKRAHAEMKGVSRKHR